LSRPVIAVHKNQLNGKTRHVKFTQKECSMSFKLQIVQEFEQGQLTVVEAIKTYDIQNRLTFFYKKS
jgi:transposase-like protein